MDFEQFMTEVDAVIENVLGVTSEDIEDFCYRDAFDDGESPYDTAMDALDAIGFGEQY